MEIKFKKQFYNKTEKNNEGEDIVQKEKKTMYRLEIIANYYNDNKLEVAKEIEKDIREFADKLKEKIEENEKALESWDSISK